GITFANAGQPNLEFFHYIEYYKSLSFSLNMQSKYWIFIGVIILASLAGSFVYPTYIDRGVDGLNAKLGWHLPHLWERPYVLGLDLQGGVHLIYQADLSTVADKAGA